MENEFENKNLCSSCKGMCCNRMGCAFSTDDFKEISFEFLKSEIEKGFISIDWWEGDIDNQNKYDRVYFLRMRNKNSHIVDPSWGGKGCILLTENGCPLSLENRPKEARLLEPKENRNCISHYPKEEYVRDWRKFYDILSALERCF